MKKGRKLSLFTNIKKNTNQQQCIKRYDKVYASSQVIGKVKRGHHSALVMIAWGSFVKALLSFIFVEAELRPQSKRIKISSSTVL